MFTNLKQSYFVQFSKNQNLAFYHVIMQFTMVSMTWATSMDAVVGVAVAVTFLVLLNALLLFCIVKRKTAKSSSSASLSSAGKNTAASTSEGKQWEKFGGGFKLFSGFGNF